MNKFIVFWVVFNILPLSAVETDADLCPELSQHSLVVILGQAFNPRYMSIIPPLAPNANAPFGNKRSPNDIPFYADKDFVLAGDFPAWETNHLNYFEVTANDEASRSRRAQQQTRSAMKSTASEIFRTRPWECTSKINWIDLGVNYFPRYIRSMECISSRCWYGHFNCKPKSFSIKVLRRKSGCVPVSEKLLVLVSESMLAEDFTELWVWEEIAVNFCCDCVMIY